MNKRKITYSVLGLVLCGLMVLNSACSMFTPSQDDLQVQGQTLKESKIEEEDQEKVQEESKEESQDESKEALPQDPIVMISDEGLISPQTEKIILEEGAVGEVTLPKDLIDSEETFSIREVKTDVFIENELESYQEAYVYDIKIGDKHELNDIIKIKLNYSDHQFPDQVDESSYVGALYFNTNTQKWEYTYYEVNSEENSVTILTDHLSQYALVTGINRSVANKQALSSEDIQKIISTPEQADLSDRALIAQAINHINTAYSVSSPFVPADISEAVINSKTYQFKAFGDMCKLYSKSNLLLKYTKALNVISAKESYEKRKTIMDLGKDVYDLVVGEALGQFSSNLAGIGTFFIDKSLNQFIDAAISGNEKAWNEMYVDYYFTGKGGRSLTWWRDHLATIVNETPFGESPSQAVHDFVNQYMNALWDDEAELASLIQERDKLSMGGISEELKRKIVEKNLKQMYESRVYPAMEKLRDYNAQMAEIELSKTLNQLKNDLYTERYFDIYFDVPSQYKGQYSMAHVLTYVGDANESYYLSSGQSTVYERIDHHQFYYLPIDVLMSGAELNYVMAAIPVENSTTEFVTAKMSASLPRYATVHISVPESYTEFEHEEEPEDKAESEDAEKDTQEESQESENQEAPEPENQEKPQEEPEQEVVQEEAPLPDTLIMNLSIADYDTEEGLEARVEIDGRPYTIYGYYNEIELQSKDSYQIKISADSYETYEGTWTIDQVINQYLGVALIPIEEEIAGLRLPVSVRDVVSNQPINFTFEAIENCEFDPSLQEIIITGYPFKFKVESDGYLAFESGPVSENLIANAPMIGLALTPLANHGNDQAETPPEQTPAVEDPPANETVIVKLKIVQYHYQTLLNTEKGARVSINGKSVDYDPSPSYMEVEVPKASSYQFTVTPIDNHTYPSDSTLYNDANYLILPISETIVSDEDIIDASFIFITPYSMKNRSLEGQSQYRGYYLP